MFGFSAKQLFMLLLLVVALFVGSKIIPALLHAYQFNDEIKQEVRFAVSTRKTTEMIRADVVQKSKDYDISISPKDLHFTRRGPAFTLQLDYVVPIDLKIYKRDLTFHVLEDGELFDQ
jgi:hypothetical protein